MKTGIRESVLTGDNTSNIIISDSRELLQKAGFQVSEIDLFTGKTTSILDDYAAFFGEGTKVTYMLRKGLMKAELWIFIRGEAFDPFTNGIGAKQRAIDNVFDLNTNAGSSGISYRYAMNRNTISVSIPLEKKAQKNH